MHREKVSMCTIWLVAYNLTNGIYCAIEYIFEKPWKTLNTVNSFGYLFVT